MAGRSKNGGRENERKQAGGGESRSGLRGGVGVLARVGRGDQ